MHSFHMDGQDKSEHNRFKSNIRINSLLEKYGGQNAKLYKINTTWYSESTLGVEIQMHQPSICPITLLFFLCRILLRTWGYGVRSRGPQD